ncbi:MAG: 50S ribosomal protein L25 [Blautia obeum]|nr:50S ribosomal protein L25 [Blautia obeum]
MNTLKAEKRSMDVKAKKLRREGFVTGNIFGREIKESIPVKIVKKDLDKLLKTNSKGSQIMLDVDGTKYDVLIKDVEFNPLKGQVDEIDFQALVSNEKVHSVAEIVIVNHDKVADGVLQENMEEINYRAYPSALVDKVEVDVAGLKVGDTIRVKDLSLAKDKDVDIKDDPEAVVLTVVAVHNGAVPETVTPEEAETEETK